MASKSFEEALVASETRCTYGQDIGGEGGPWDELASGYWGLWHEMENCVFQESSIPSPGEDTTPNSDQSAENVYPIVQNPQDKTDLDILKGVSVELTEDLIMSLGNGIGDLPVFSQEDLLGLPPKAFRDELVTLFFKHVHPLCPVFDEVEFHAAYYRKGADLAFLQSSSLVEFQALLFAGSLVFYFIYASGGKLC